MLQSIGWQRVRHDLATEQPITQGNSKDFRSSMPETGDKDQKYLLLHQSLSSALQAVHNRGDSGRGGQAFPPLLLICVPRATANSHRTFAWTKKASWKKLLLALAPVPGPQPGKLSSCISPLPPPPAPTWGPSIHPAPPVDPADAQPDHTGCVGLRQWFSVQLTNSLKWSQHKEHHVCSGMQIIPTECRQFF